MRWLVLSCVALLLNLRVTSAQTTTNAEDELLREAIAAYEARDLDEARALFEAMHAARPTARTLRGLGVIAVRQERLCEAVQLLEASLDSRDKPLTPELAAGVEVLLREALSQVARIELNQLPEAALVRIDGEDALRDQGGALLLLPGAHTLSMSAPGRKARTLEVVVQAGSVLAIHAALAQQEPETDSASTAGGLAPDQVHDASVPLSADRSDVRTRRGQRLRRARYAMWALAAAGLGTSLVATALGLKRVRSIEDGCRASPTRTCTPSQAREESRGARLQLLSGLSISGAIAGAAGAAAGTVLSFTIARSDRPGGERASAWSLGLRGTF